LPRSQEGGPEERVLRNLAKFDVKNGSSHSSRYAQLVWKSGLEADSTSRESHARAREGNPEIPRVHVGFRLRRKGLPQWFPAMDLLDTGFQADAGNRDFPRRCKRAYRMKSTQGGS